MFGTCSVWVRCYLGSGSFASSSFLLSRTIHIYRDSGYISLVYVVFTAAKRCSPPYAGARACNANSSRDCSGFGTSKCTLGTSKCSKWLFSVFVFGTRSIAPSLRVVLQP